MSNKYRVIRTDYLFDGEAHPTYTIHRCVYAKPEDVVPVKYGKQEAAPEGESIEELRGDLQLMLAALERPILMTKRDKLVEVK